MSIIPRKKMISVVVFGFLAFGLGIYGTVATVASQRPDVLSFAGDRLVMQANPLAVNGGGALRAKDDVSSKVDDLGAKEDDLRDKDTYSAKEDNL